MVALGVGHDQVEGNGEHQAAGSARIFPMEYSSVSPLSRTRTVAIPASSTLMT